MASLDVYIQYIVKYCKKEFFFSGSWNYPLALLVIQAACAHPLPYMHMVAKTGLALLLAKMIYGPYDRNSLTQWAQILSVRPYSNNTLFRQLLLSAECWNCAWITVWISVRSERRPLASLILCNVTVTLWNQNHSRSSWRRDHCATDMGWMGGIKIVCVKLCPCHSLCWHFRFSRHFTG